MPLSEHLLDIVEIGREVRMRVCRSTIIGGGRVGFIVVGVGGGEEVNQRRVRESILCGSCSEVEKKSHGRRLRFLKVRV